MFIGTRLFFSMRRQTPQMFCFETRIKYKPIHARLKWLLYSQLSINPAQRRPSLRIRPDFSKVHMERCDRRLLITATGCRDIIRQSLSAPKWTKSTHLICPAMKWINAIVSNCKLIRTWAVGPRKRSEVRIKFKPLPLKSYINIPYMLTMLHYQSFT